MKPHHTVITLSLLSASFACAAVQDENLDAGPAQAPVPDETANPMAYFARMVDGEWQVKFLSGTSQFNRWHWGPGGHSMRVQVHGADAAGKPWRELRVLYRHPARKQVCLLGLSPFAAGVAEGTIRFEGQTAEAVFDLYQRGDHRKMARRWTFIGPDRYREALLEDTGNGLTPLVELDFLRSTTLAAIPTAEGTATPSKHLRTFGPLLGHTWEAEGDWVPGDAFRIQSTFEWVPYCNAVYARTTALTKDGQSAHLLDAYIFHHTGTDAVHCLVLTNQGGVYEGDVTVPENGAVQFDLKRYEAGRVASRIARFDFQNDGTLHQRIWSLRGSERTIILDVHHEKIERKSD